MNATQVANLHVLLMQQLYEAAPFYLPELVIVGGTRSSLGFEEKDILRELGFLESKGLVEKEEHPTSAGLLRWKLTDKGFDHLRRNKMV